MQYAGAVAPNLPEVSNLREVLPTEKQQQREVQDGSGNVAATPRAGASFACWRQVRYTAYITCAKKD
jgi:hypothetical protein